MSKENTLLPKSEILFLYESTYSIPNGDPFTGEQRYDEETKKALVSDVRIKRFIRDYFLSLNQSLIEEKRYNIYVWNDLSQAAGKISGAAARMKSLKDQFKKDESVKVNGKMDALKLMKKCIDVRLFGGISTEENDAVNLTGPVQFALLNPSLNQVELRIHQNTSVFVSSVKKSQGAIATTTVVPYSLNQIHGWINPFSARETDLTQEDINLMFKALWESINSANTRTKSNQNSLLLLEIRYLEPTKKLYGVDRLVEIKTKESKQEERIRSMDDLDFNFAKLQEAVNSEVVQEVRYYTKLEDIKNKLLSDSNVADKFQKINFPNHS